MSMVKKGQVPDRKKDYPHLGRCYANLPDLNMAPRQIEGQHYSFLTWSQLWQLLSMIESVFLGTD